MPVGVPDQEGDDDDEIRRLITPQDHEFTADLNLNNGLDPWLACDSLIKQHDGAYETTTTHSATHGTLHRALKTRVLCRLAVALPRTAPPSSTSKCENSVSKSKHMTSSERKKPTSKFDLAGSKCVSKTTMVTNMSYQSQPRSSRTLTQSTSASQVAISSFQSVELFEAIADLPVGKAVIVPRERRLCNDIHPELPLIGAVGM